VLIVVADKDPYDLQALEAGLSAPDREVLIVADGENVVTLAMSRHVDVAIVGASLGHMGGFAVSRELKMHADTGTIVAPKVVVMIEREADIWLANWARADAYLVKPVDIEALVTLIGELAAQPV
jgi:two-component system nitrate/nitrite response regulator NarL